MRPSFTMIFCLGLVPLLHITAEAQKRKVPARIEVAAYHEGKDLVIYFAPWSEDDFAAPYGGNVKITIEMRMNGITGDRLYLLTKHILFSDFKLARVGIWKTPKILALFRIDASSPPPNSPGYPFPLTTFLETLQNENNLDLYVVVEFVPDVPRRFTRNRALVDSIQKAKDEYSRRRFEADSIEKVFITFKNSDQAGLDSLKIKEQKILESYNLTKQDLGIYNVLTKQDSALLFDVRKKIDSTVAKKTGSIQRDSIRSDSLKREALRFRNSWPFSWENIEEIRGDTLYLKTQSKSLTNECKLNW